MLCSTYFSPPIRLACPNGPKGMDCELVGATTSKHVKAAAVLANTLVALLDKREVPISIPLLDFLRSGHNLALLLINPLWQLDAPTASVQYLAIMNQSAQTNVHLSNLSVIVLFNALHLQF